MNLARLWYTDAALWLINAFMWQYWVHVGFMAFFSLLAAGVCAYVGYRLGRS